MKSALCCFAVISCFSRAELTKEEAVKTTDEIYAEMAAERSLKMKEASAGFKYFEVSAAGKKMKCLGKLYGEAKAGERALYISMHGGGGTTARANDQQWNNQVQLYVPKEGWYVAPRAPTNTWNLWHEGHIDALFGKMIEDMVAKYGVDPNRVYLMGYSAGGDGVYQLAPRMADRFGAATMMAGHPNDATADGLYALPFRIYMGGKDAAYKRNEVAARWGAKLAALQRERGGYEHKVTIYPEMGHWMKKKDSEAVPWMATKTREAWPKKVIWGKSGKRSERFYWLGGTPKDVIFASVEGQKITINGAGRDELELYLSDELVDLDDRVTVIVDGKEVQSSKVVRSKDAIGRSLEQRLDPKMAASVILRINDPVGENEVQVLGFVENPKQVKSKADLTIEKAIEMAGGVPLEIFKMVVERRGEKYTYISSREEHLAIKLYGGDRLEIKELRSPEKDE